MKRLYTVLAVLMLFASYAGAQVVTERCWHLDKVQFLQHKQDFWRSHKLYSTSAQPVSLFSGGYYNATEVTYGIGLKDVSVPYSNNHIGITTVNGMRFGNGLAIGLGVGYLQYNLGETGTGWLLPVFGDVRYFIGSQKNKFFVMADGGFLLSVEDFKGLSRAFLNPALGIVIPVSKSTHLSFSTGLLTQYIIPSPHNRDSFINMKLGLVFGK
ncbi:MAG: hypothetical protein U5L72_17145 [Bacteroidales bacterium]|nr:hypothetical protein [Bacteroidales bacterium]